MVEVRFYDTVNDELLKFAVIISQSNYIIFAVYTGPGYP